MRKTISTLAAGTATALVLAVPALAQQNDDRYWHGPGMMWGGGYNGGFGMIFGPIIMLLILAAIVVGIVWMLRVMGAIGHPAGTTPTPSSDKALDILKERFAKGEIDAKEFDERKRLLSD